MTQPAQQHHHRSSLKQKNKPFKGGNVRSKSRGRTEGVSKGAVSKTAGRTLNQAKSSKADRRNQAAMMQAAKKAELAAERRIFTGKEGAPRVVFVLPVSPSADAQEAISRLGDGQESSGEGTTFWADAKQKLRWLCPSPSWDIAAICDAAAVADVVVFVASAEDGLGLDDDHGALFAVLRAQGLSSTAALLQKSSMPSMRKVAAKEVRAQWLTVLSREWPSLTKVFAEEEPIEVKGLLRALSTQKLNGISWREARPYLLADGLAYDEASGRLQISGYGRGGQAFSANRLVHLQGVGSLSVEKIELLSGANRGGNGMAMDSLVQLPGEDAEPLPEEPRDVPEEENEMENDVSASGSKSTPTAVATKKIRVPKGTSSYQAAWLVDQDNLDDDEEEEEEEEAEEVALETRPEPIPEDDDDDQQMDLDNAEDDDVERCESYKYFPDQVDVAAGQLARDRFRKYRGLQSLRTGHWDPEEGLPREYAHIVQFENWKQSWRAALSGRTDSPFSVGQRVSITLTGVSAESISKLHEAHAQGQAILLYGLLPHEQHTSVLNFLVTPSSSDQPLCNKEEVIAWFGGFRRYLIKPVYSEHSPTSALHRQLGQVDPGVTAVGTIYGPIHYPPSPVLLFSASTGRLMATGSVLSADPRRIVLKRITLTAAPYKVHRRAAVARWMFAHPADVAWFKPVELVTLSGRRGAIRESLGTHGHFKCLFDRAISHDDVIAMHLYKRAFPKWNTTKQL
jgi:pre-rRNA-processing protein TSR1